MELDNWQEQVLLTEGNICLRSGRQVGKSTVIAVKAGEFSINNPKTLTMVIAATERQAYLMFEKILAYLFDHYKKEIKSGKDRPTKHKISLKNGSTIHCLPTGETGYGIRGYTVDLLIADEAAFIPEDVWTALTPALAVTHGLIILLSTPHGREGYYYECFNDPNFTAFHVSSEDCPRISKEFLAQEKKRKTAREYAEEYLGEFADDLMQFFPDNIINQCIVPPNDISFHELPLFSGGDLYLGVDIAALGNDDTVLVSIKKSGDILQMIDMEITRKTHLTETIERIKAADRKWDFRRVYIDTGGIGTGVFDVLLRDDQTKRKVVAINNAARSINRDATKKTRILKEDLYSNLLRLMEQKKIFLMDNDEVRLSLKSMQYEYTDDKRIKIYGRYSHIAEALVRAAWCVEDKGTNIWIR